ncbi:hypothetical protein Tco_1030821 [Tanacetum coccineum]|uniref:Uncharacterized protein n=1 Tax=Tanacetum coccineum TaxID=301880 RepID=A0ABQ5G8Q5_9ASTR
MRRIRTCTHQRPQRKLIQYVVSRGDQYAVLEIWNEYNILEDIKRGPYSKKLQYAVSNPLDMPYRTDFQTLYKDDPKLSFRVNLVEFVEQARSALNEWEHPPLMNLRLLYSPPHHGDIMNFLKDKESKAARATKLSFGTSGTQSSTRSFQLNLWKLLNLVVQASLFIFLKLQQLPPESAIISYVDSRLTCMPH